MTRYIGVDLHTNCFTACVLEAKAKQAFREYKLSEIEQFALCVYDGETVTSP